MSYQTIKHHTNETGAIVAHILDTVAFSSEKTIASIVLLLSTIPEFYAMQWSLGFTLISVASAAISLVSVKLALRTKTRRIAIADRNIPYNKYWLLYACQLSVGAVFVIASGAYIHIGLILISMVGAVCSEEIAHIIKIEMRENAKFDIEIERNQIKIEELRRKAELRIEDKENELNQKWSVVEDAAAKPMENETAVSTKTLANNRNKAKSTVSAKVAQRRGKLHQLINDGAEINYSQLANAVGVKSANTIKKDLQELGLI